MSQTPPLPPMSPDPAPPPPVRRMNSMAVAAIALGAIALFVPILGVVAIGLGVVAIRKTGAGRDRGRRLAVGGVALGVVGLLLSVATYFALQKAHAAAARVACASNLRQIAIACRTYADDNHGQYPPDLGLLFARYLANPQTAVCPGSQDTPAPSVAEVGTGGHLSYHYVGAGINRHTRQLSDTVVAYEDPANHGGKINVLYADGHVDFLDAAQTFEVLPQLKVPPSTTLPAVKKP